MFRSVMKPVFMAVILFSLFSGSTAIAATGFITNDSALWTTTGTTTTTSSSMTMNSAAMEASINQTTSTTNLQFSRYGYDELDRLAWVQYEDGTAIVYTYDKVGNRTQKQTYMATNNYFSVTSMAPYGGAIIPAGTLKVPAGSSQTFIINPNPGYCLANVYIDGLPIGITPTYTFSNIADNRYISANITPHYSCPISGGYSYNPSDGYCEYAPCPEGYTFSPQFNTCTYSQDCRCPADYFYVEMDDTCYINGCTNRSHCDQLPGGNYCTAYPLQGSCWGYPFNTTLNVCQAPVTNNCPQMSGTAADFFAQYSYTQQCNNYPAQLVGAATTNHLSLVSAYNAANSGDIIKGNKFDHNESLRFDRDVAVTLDGGYDCYYGTKNAVLPIKGIMIVAKGSISINGPIVLSEP